MPGLRAGIAIRTEEEPLSCAYERFALDGTSLGERTAADGLENIVLPEPEEDYLVELAFPEDIRLEEITVYDMVLTDSRENFLENTDGLGKGTKLQPEAPVLYLDENGKAMERGYPKNDRTGGVLRGFLFQCRFADGREEVYSAAVRTDADFGTGTESSV